MQRTGHVLHFSAPESMGTDSYIHVRLGSFKQ
jgi:hypothetical protein